jgi:uncharacterized protein YqgC (DUF456 family)
MDIFLLVLGAVLLLLGFAGTIVPVLPGAPLAWLGLFAAFFSKYCDISVTALVITAILAILVSVLDNVFPVVFTKKSGGSRAGTWGATLGLIAGLFTGPAGILLGPFLGALCGELIHNFNDKKQALNAAVGAFKGFLAGTGIKMICCAVCIWIYIKSF